MIILASAITLLVVLYMLWPRYDGGGIHYNIALVCTPCSIIALTIIAIAWLTVWGLS